MSRPNQSDPVVEHLRAIEQHLGVIRGRIGCLFFALLVPLVLATAAGLVMMSSR